MRSWLEKTSLSLMHGMDLDFTEREDRKNNMKNVDGKREMRQGVSRDS